MIILGLETSCDETAASVIEAEGDLNDLRFKLLGSAVQSQIEVHRAHGGVFPALAKREHLKNLPLVYEEALKKAGIEESQIEMIAVTVGPGLEPALWTGINFAENLSKRLLVPVIGSNHMLGHIASVLFQNEKVTFPALALLISGGHTELVFLESWQRKTKIGETQDDAVGEAFDKVARMLGLSYPGGPEISRLAEEARQKNLMLEKRLPRPMIHSKDFNFSFSGLKTAVLYYLRDLKNRPVSKPEVAREFEDAVIETLLTKTRAAIEKYLPWTLIVGGGVIANKALRENFLQLKDQYPHLEVLIPEQTLTTDNATMIAAAGFIQYLSDEELELKADGNLDIS